MDWLDLRALPDPLAIQAVVGPAPVKPFHARVRPPGSKSLTNRALLLAALARGESVLRGALVQADDAQRMIAAVRELGATVEITPDAVRVVGVGGRWRPRAGLRALTTLDLNNAGTATRFLAAAALLAPGPIVIDGNARMRQRPIGELAWALQALGAEVQHLGTPGFPPLRITPPPELPMGPVLEIPTTLSSQFVSALLLIGPWIPGGITLRLRGEVTSASYVRMTTGLLDQLGATVRTSEDLGVVRVGHGAGRSGGAGGIGLDGFSLEIEPDASGATYFWAAAAMVPGATCVVEGLRASGSLQGDAEFPRLLERMGATVIDEPAGLGIRGPAGLTGIDADLALMPDTAMTLAAAAAIAQGPSILRGLRTLRVKETDRIEAMRCELGKAGVSVRVGVDGMTDAIAISPHESGLFPPRSDPIIMHTYDDHRMAMSLSLLGLRVANLCIADPGCVAKTYAAYWQDLARVCSTR